MFVTSQQEVYLLCSKLKKTFPKRVGGGEVDDGEKKSKKEKNRSIEKRGEGEELKDCTEDTTLLNTLPDLKLEKLIFFFNFLTILNF